MPPAPLSSFAAPCPSPRRSPGKSHHVPVIILVADGARPDTLSAAIDRGDLPALRQLRAEGGAHTVVTAWPSVTGVAYTPFLLGRFPGPVGLPGLRWFDRARQVSTLVGHARSYVGADMRLVDRDLAGDAPTMFELASTSLGALNVISRGLPPRSRLGFGMGFAARAAFTHFRGDVSGWLSIDRDIGAALVRRIREERPDFVFAAFTGIDKSSHSMGHDSRTVLDAMRIIDATVAEIRHDAERRGTWDETHIWIVSDHGHSPVSRHDDLVDRVRKLGLRTLAHPWVFGNSHQAAVMVSGNAMAHLYLELGRGSRPFWSALSDRWSERVTDLLNFESVDLAIVPHSATRFEIHGRGRGRAFIERTNGHYDYRPKDGDPLGIGERSTLSRREAYDVTVDSDYPDAIVQITHLAASERVGDVILSASRDWDFRARYEPIRHVSSHGALHREHMLVPLIVNRPVASTPLRTTDVMPSALTALGIPVPGGLDGESFL
jgi:hypothetical protein